MVLHPTGDYGERTLQEFWLHVLHIFHERQERDDWKEPGVHGLG